MILNHPPKISESSSKTRYIQIAGILVLCEQTEHNRFDLDKRENPKQTYRSQKLTRETMEKIPSRR